MSKINLNSSVLAVLASSLICLASAFSANAQSDYYMSMPDVQANGGGTVTVPINLNNAGGIFSLQIELFLPDGVDVLSIEGTDRIADAEYFNYSQDKFTDDNQRYRRIYIANIQNMAASAISGNEGAVLNITFQLPEGEGVYPISLKNLQYINPPTYAISNMDDVEANITAKDYFFTFPDDIQATCGETFIVPLNLHNAGIMYSIQIDLMLADGVEFVDATLGERVSAEFFQYGSEDKYTDDGLRYRRVVFANLTSTESTISGNEGPVVYYELKVAPNHTQESYPIRVMNLQYFMPPTYELHFIDDAEGTINVSAMIGDVNHDGKVNITDVTTLINYLLTSDDNAACQICGNVNNDDKVNITDVTALINLLLSSD